VWNIFHRRSPPEQQVTTGRFEIEQDGQTAYLDYSLTGDILELIHTEVPPRLRHLGLASALAENALQWARERGLKVDIVCPTVRRYVDQHPEYADLEMR
jgi:predicted GNAT family acetyltransferase